ncbi:ABC-2 type transport system ATP-binding protein [Salsuginibacillus halophilus]|uniref:ABC-2 type transport system ATP-binding protein n=1 Tax=Salsuginibacillus halophilus TaxID=517424 RepID=A0A2P8HAP1_9BACI|nr:ABC transporter ATP-binding protein [Salsuginibacillus halophilus]PSL43251.1 ABC-2 type transport system ATP-binding protein [Salsuginibacillus halophilus]
MLTVKNLSKKFKKSDVYAVKDVSFELTKGEIVGLLGKNGAGKTTIMKLIAKSLIPTEGEIVINDRDILKGNNMLKDVNLMIESAFFNHLSAYENIKFYLTINDMDYSEKEIKNVLMLVDLWEEKDHNPSQFSFGMKQRLGLAMCLSSAPKLVVMDEPFVGLDPNGVTALIEKLREWVVDRELTVLISSHQLSELEMICDRYIYIDNGLLVKEFDKSLTSVTVIKINDEIDPSVIQKFEHTEMNHKEITTSLENEHFNDLIKVLSEETSITDINKKDHLKDLFKKGEEV